ncbi:MAG: ribonuclease H-like domain-containing protein [Acidimicrobiales bacterium]
MSNSLLYGLDIETDTAAGGLDPRVARVVAVALSSGAGETVFTGDEPDVLTALDAHLAACPAGVIVTWNGAAFDLPFLVHRARRAGVVLGLLLRADPAIVRHHPSSPETPFAYRGRWHHHRHLDAYRAYRRLTDPGTSCGLKAVARSAGLVPIEVDSAAIHELPPALLRRYVASDARVTRQLALRRWREISAFVDPPAPSTQEPVTPGTEQEGGSRPPPPTP